MDYIQNGQAYGDVATTLLDNNFDTDALRPFKGKDGRHYVTHNTGEVDKDGNPVQVAVPTVNANATLLRLEWTQLDEAVIRAAMPRLKAVADLRGRNLQYTIPNGMSKTVLQSQAQSDISGANVSMDGLSDAQSDRPQYNLTNLPLPIIHKDFHFSARQIAVSRNGNMPLDTSMAELAGRKVAEGAEQLLLGVASSYSYGGGTIYGYTNWPSRTTKTLSSPLDSGWTPRVTVLDILDMRSTSQENLHHGPWVLYVSLKWDRFLDDDLSVYKGDGTLRDRIKRIDGITDVVTLDYLNGYDMLLVQMTTDVIREVVGMDITTVQWPSHGGMQLNFKVMCIMVPQLRGDYNGRTGIIHGAVSGHTEQTAGFVALNTNNP